MWIIIIIISIVFIVISFILNEKNAKYLLAGYNTMSDEERESFDIIGFLKAFKRIFILIGLSILFSYILLYFCSLEHYSFILISLIPVILLPYLLFISKKIQAKFIRWWQQIKDFILWDIRSNRGWITNNISSNGALFWFKWD